MKNMGNSHSIPSKSCGETERGRIIAFPFQKKERAPGLQSSGWLNFSSSEYETAMYRERRYRRHDTVNENQQNSEE